MVTVNLTQDNYRQYAPYDIVVVNESFRKLFDRRCVVFKLDYDTPPPVGDLFNCDKDTTLEDALCNENWMKIESTINRPQFTATIRYFVHNSIKDEYLERNNGKVKWDEQIVYETLVHRHRINLTSHNYKDFTPRKIMAIAGTGITEIIDEYGDWFLLGRITEDELNSVFANNCDFNFEHDETFFHMGLGTGMWVDKSIVNEFRAEVDRVCKGYFDNRPYLLHPVWNEIVWSVLEKRN